MFIYFACQHGAESFLKSEMQTVAPSAKFAFSRPGFVTFRTEDSFSPNAINQLPLTFARTRGISVGRTGKEHATDEARADYIRNTLADIDTPVLSSVSQKPSIVSSINQIHVWQRDSKIPGEDGFEPGRTEVADTAGHIIRERLQIDSKIGINRIAKSGQLVFDCVLVEPDQWWFGYHVAEGTSSRWPGGVYSLRLPEHAVSRAYLKMEESIRWSQLPLQAGDTCVEIGSSPGGSCQALLDRGMNVIGIDPAQMHESVLAHANFTHHRARAADLKRSAFSEAKWLFSDSNVAPNYTLDSVEHIVENRRVNLHGLVLTLKLMQPELAEQIPSYIERVKKWGYQYVRLRQLAFNRREVCMVAMKSRSYRRRRPKSRVS